MAYPRLLLVDRCRRLHLAGECWILRKQEAGYPEGTLPSRADSIVRQAPTAADPASASSPPKRSPTGSRRRGGNDRRLWGPREPECSGLGRRSALIAHAGDDVFRVQGFTSMSSVTSAIDAVRSLAPISVRNRFSASARSTAVTPHPIRCHVGGASSGTEKRRRRVRAGGLQRAADAGWRSGARENDHGQSTHPPGRLE